MDKSMIKDRLDRLILLSYMKSPFNCPPDGLNVFNKVNKQLLMTSLQAANICI